MSKLKKKRKPPANAQFQVGGRVRVRHGNVDEDYPDMPLGGWVGTITEIHKDGMATVRWSRETLSAIHPIYAKRCERDGTRVEEYWIEEKDLEPDPGGPLEIEQPLEIRTDPLDPKDQDDWIRMVFGLTSNDPLPAVDVTTSRAFYEHLRNHLTISLDTPFRYLFRT